MARPIRAPRHTLNSTIEALHAALDRQPANVPVWLGRCALEDLETAQREQREVWAARHTEELYARLVAEHNAIWDAARAAGVEVYQPMGDLEHWHWTRGDAHGIADTAAAALIAALSAA